LIKATSFLSSLHTESNTSLPILMHFVSLTQRMKHSTNQITLLVMIAELRLCTTLERNSAANRRAIRIKIGKEKGAKQAKSPSNQNAASRLFRSALKNLISKAR